MTHPTESLRVDLGPRSYDIQLRHHDVAGTAKAIAQHVQGSAFIIAGEPVWKLHGAPLQGALAAAGVDVPAEHVLLVPDGERSKSFATIGRLLDELLPQRPGRQSAIIALGGGVVGDIAGFVAAICLRGIDVVQVPTTVVSMVDSAVGGKTGVDHPAGKNLIGAFHQPRLVAIDTAYLQTLDPEEIRGGFAEVLKYGVIDDAAFFAWLEQGNLQAALQLDGPALRHAVLKSCAIKAKVVGQDERESEGGTRAFLNYGHTFGHAIEANVLAAQEAGHQFSGWAGRAQVHGHCVAIGMACAADMAVSLGMLGRDAAERIERLILAAGLPVRLPDGLDIERVIDAMASDKKVRAGKVRFVLPKGIGQVELVAGVSPDEIRKTIRGRA